MSEYCHCIGSSYTSERIETTLSPKWDAMPWRTFTPSPISCNACGLAPMPVDWTRSPGAAAGRGVARLTGHDWRAIADSLAIDEPWSSSLEGLDDCCMFCGSDDMRYVRHGPTQKDGRMVYTHDAVCPWIAARKALGYADTNHTTEETTT